MYQNLNKIAVYILELNDDYSLNKMQFYYDRIHICSACHICLIKSNYYRLLTQQSSCMNEYIL